jgi:16S rRNA (guanine527-N7)-methyltransferase
MEILNRFIERELNMDSSVFQKEFDLYNELLLEWNKKVNLVSRKTVSIEDHILNSIFFLTKHNIEKAGTIADIGTGGGFPGIPLKILFPEKEITLIDSIRKKVSAVNDIIENIKLEKINAVCARAEEISEKKEFKNKFDTVISKAVAPLDNLYLWGKNFMKRNGEMLCIKGGNIDEELASLNKLKYKFDVKVINFNSDKTYKIEDKKLVIIKNPA